MQTATRKSIKPVPKQPPPLEDLLADMVAAQECLLRATRAHREAIRRADAAALAGSRDAMSAACARIAALDAERRATAAALAPSEPGVTLTALASRLPEPRRARALEIAGTLRALALQTRNDQQRLRAATDSMLRHVRGVIQHLQRSLNHAGVYGRAGRVEPGAAVVSGIDLTR